MYSRLLKYSTEVMSGATGAAKKERGAAQNKRLRTEVLLYKA